MKSLELFALDLIFYHIVPIVFAVPSLVTTICFILELTYMPSALYYTIFFLCPILITFIVPLQKLHFGLKTSRNSLCPIITYSQNTLLFSYPVDKGIQTSNTLPSNIHSTSDITVCMVNSFFLVPRQEDDLRVV
jgi:hypothetical protein